jgi:hypothetical protein
MLKDAKLVNDGVQPLGAPSLMNDGINDNIFALAGVKMKGG